MDTEQDGNMEIKMSGEKMREGYTISDKKADEGSCSSKKYLEKQAQGIQLRWVD